MAKCEAIRRLKLSKSAFASTSMDIELDGSSPNRKKLLEGIWDCLYWKHGLSVVLEVARDLGHGEADCKASSPVLACHVPPLLGLS